MVKILVKYKFLVFSVSCLVGLLFFVRVFTPEPTKADLIVYAYSSFTASWGAGPVLKKKFEEHCQCKIQIRDAEDGRLLVQRLQLEGQREGADVVIGLNQWDVDEAVDKLGFQSTEMPSGLLTWDFLSPVISSRGPLLPFDWGLLTINTKISNPIATAKNLEELLSQLPPKSLALQDPRTSAPGLTFLFWLVQALGEEKAFAYLDRLHEKIFSIAPSWSLSYGLFQKGQAQAVVSYVTSPLYHQIEEKDLNYLALSMQEGLPLHIEFAGVLSTCKHCNRAHDFVKFLLTPEAQEVLMRKNYMLPIDQKVVANTPWSDVRQFKVFPPMKVSKADKDSLLSRWTKWVREH